ASFGNDFVIDDISLVAIPPASGVPVTVRVDDGRGGGDTQSFSIKTTPGTGEISGNGFNDLDGDGNLPVGSASSEPGLAGWTVYLDQNGNGHLDANELSTVSDVAGNYLFTNLAAGKYIIREVNKVGWNQTPRANAANLLLNGDFEDPSFTI